MDTPANYTHLVTMLDQLSKALGGVAGGYIFYVQILQIYMLQTPSTGVGEFIKTKVVWTLTSLTLVMTSVLALIQQFLSIFDNTVLSQLNYALPGGILGLVLW